MEFITFTTLLLRGLTPRLNDQTFSSNTVFVTQNVRWPNGQTMFDQTLDNGKPLM